MTIKYATDDDGTRYISDGKRWYYHGNSYESSQEVHNKSLIKKLNKLSSGKSKPKFLSRIPIGRKLFRMD